MEGNLISVIVPVYKVEKYLNRCVESIINQTYKNLEIILVNDGSPDNCPKICEDWASKDLRIKVVCKENGGISSARNFGLRYATGEYIAFIDSDDYVDVTMFEKLMKSAIENKSDVVICGFKNVYEDGGCEDVIEKNLPQVTNENILYYYIISNTKKVNKQITTDTISPSVWRMLYSKEVIKDIYFEEDVRYGEDLLFNVEVFSKSIKISTVMECLYFYFQRKGSAVRLINENMLKTKFNYAIKKLKLADLIKDESAANAFKFSIYKMIYWDLVKYKNISAYKKYYPRLLELNLNLKQYYKDFQDMSLNKQERLINYLMHKNKIHIMRFCFDVKQNIKQLFKRG
ncbi:MAG: glycosyltransferase [Clostridia bacterium]|nr:glycosyltransferase [Clostridia bacterium]